MFSVCPRGGGGSMWPLPMMHWTSLYRPTPGTGTPETSDMGPPWPPLDIRHGNSGPLLVTSGGHYLFSWGPPTGTEVYKYMAWLTGKLCLFTFIMGLNTQLSECMARGVTRAHFVFRKQSSEYIQLGVWKGECTCRPQGQFLCFDPYFGLRMGYPLHLKVQADHMRIMLHLLDDLAINCMKNRWYSVLSFTYIIVWVGLLRDCWCRNDEICRLQFIVCSPFFKICISVDHICE